MTKEQSYGLGIASFVIGVMGIFFSWFPFFGLFTGGLGLILGLVQKGWSQHGLSIAGVTINGLWLSVQMFWIVLFIIGLFAGA